MAERLQLVMLGTDHHVANVQTREHLVITGDALPQTLVELHTLPNVEECVILSTCNRTEIYAILLGEQQELLDGRRLLGHFLTNLHGLQFDAVAGSLYYLTEMDVAHHLFRVSSGLESMVLGEVEILGQVKGALQSAQRMGTVGKWLHTLFRHALQTGKRARSETEISHSAASVSSAAVSLARNVLPELSSSQVLLVGAGATAELAARTLVAHGVEGIIIINRTRARAERLAAELHGMAGSLEELLNMLVAADIVMTSTDAPHAILTAEAVATVLPARRGRPLVIIDLAVPRDVEHKVGSLEGVHLYNLDDLEAFVSTTMQRRIKESSKVDAIILEEIEQFAAWKSSRKVASTITRLQRRAEEVRRGELDRVATRLSDLSPEERAAVEAATRAIVNKMLHHPISLLKEAAVTDEGENYARTIRELFGLPAELTRSAQASSAAQQHGDYTRFIEAGGPYTTREDA